MGEFVRAIGRAPLPEIVALHLEYMTWATERFDALDGLDIPAFLGLPLADLVALMAESVCSHEPLDGSFYVVREDGRAAGMGGLRGLGAGETEMIRIYVRPEFRGDRLGTKIVQRLLSDARESGCTKVRLASAHFMTSAHRLYERSGFVDCAPYPGSDIPPPITHLWRFMEREL